MDTYFGFCFIIAFINMYRGWKFLPVFLLSVFLTPVAGLLLTVLRGKNEEALQRRRDYQRELRKRNRQKNL